MFHYLFCFINPIVVVFFGVNSSLETAVLFPTGARKDSQLNNSFDKGGRFVKKGR